MDECVKINLLKPGLVLKLGKNIIVCGCKGLVILLAYTLHELIFIGAVHIPVPHVVVTTWML